MPNDPDMAEPMVAMDQTRIPAKITLRGPIRSATGPDTSEATANTARLTDASRPTWNFESPNVVSMNGVMP